MPKPITVVHNFGGRRHPPPALPPSVRTWGMWDCDPTSTSGRPPTQRHAYGKHFPWTFDLEEKAYVLEGSATLTADDEARHGPPVTVVPGDMVTFPKKWSGVWEVHSFLRKVYAFFDREGVRIDEEIEEEEEEEDNDAPVGRGVGAHHNNNYQSSASSSSSASFSRLRKKVRAQRFSGVNCIAIP